MISIHGLRTRSNGEGEKEREEEGEESVREFITNHEGGAHGVVVAKRARLFVFLTLNSTASFKFLELRLLPLLPSHITHPLLAVQRTNFLKTTCKSPSNLLLLPSMALSPARRVAVMEEEKTGLRMCMLGMKVSKE